MNGAQDLQAPGAFLLALEGRAPWELGATLATLPWLRKAAEGDGHPVIVYPGPRRLGPEHAAAAHLPAAARLRRARLGAQAQLRAARRACSSRVSSACIAIRRETGRRVSLVGWSLGGVYAREIAKLLPEDVRCVITMGTPFTGTPEGHERMAHLRARERPQAGRPRGAGAGALGRRRCRRRRSSAAPTAWSPGSARSRSRDTLAENIELTASHVGMGLNPAAWYAVADRLAQREGKWKPFHREGWRQWVFHDPDRA